MSHAVVLVSPSREMIAELGIESALAWEMEPFKENEECFADGSRWDWYVIGGRWTGFLTGYEPENDSANTERCHSCGGTGIRPNGREDFGEEWFKAVNGCNGCKGTGKSVKWPTQWKKYPGDIMQVGTFEATSAAAFLSNRHWHENERLGWFGVSTATECERKDPLDPDKVFGKCLHKDKASGARIVCWNEPHEVWSENYYQRFIAPLSPDRQVIVVDYHV